MTDPTDPDPKERSRGVSFDMSSAAMEHRLEIMAQLYDVWLLLRTAKRIGPVGEHVAESEPGPWPPSDRES